MSRARTFFKFAVGAAVVIVLGVALIGRTSRNRLDEELQAFETKYRAMGYPVTLEELKAAHAVPEGEANAADEYRLAFEKMTDEGFDFELLPIVGEAQIEPGEAMSREMFSEISAYLAANEEAFVHLRRAMEIPVCRFPFDFDDPLEFDMSNSDPYGGMNRGKYMRHSARLVALRALFAIAIADSEEAIGAIRELLALSEAELQQPDLHSYFVSRAIISIGFAQIRYLLSSMELSDTQFTLLYDAINHLDEAEDERRVLLNEYILSEADYTRIDETPIWDGYETWIEPRYWPTAGSLFVYRAGHFDIQDRRAMLRQYRALIDAVDAPAAALPVEFAEIDKYGGYSIFWMGDMRKASVGPIAQLYRVFLVAGIDYASALSALAIEQFRISEGTMPDTLQELVATYMDNVPIDPFDGKPMRYTQHANGYVLYSVGMDNLDQGGYDFEANESLGDDQVFVVHRP